MNNKKATKAGFIIPSVIGIFLFMIPIKFDGSWTIAVKILADAISGAIGGILPTLCCIVLTISAVMCVIALFKPKFITENKLLSDAFSCGPIWVVSRVLGCIFCWMTYLQVGQDKGTGIAAAITGADQGGLALDLIVGLVIIFLIASYLLPLLLDFGLLEYVGAMLTKFMRPIFKVPGRAAVDCITSFSAVSITFSLVVLAELGLTQYFGVYYLLICFVGIVCAIICPRIWPLAKKPDTYLVEGRAMPDELPDGYTSSHQYGLDLALKRVSEHKGIGEFFANGTKNCLNMWFGVLPTVMCIGTVALLLANYTPLFDWLGIPFRPLLSVLGVPDVEAAASTMVVGFTDMFTPAIIISGAHAQPMTCFIVAVISITQVLFLDEVGGLILSSKLPINLLELFVIFLERTIISLLIVCPIAHLIF